MRPHERGHEHLVVDAEQSQLRRLELTLDHYAAAGEADPLDHERLSARQVRQLLPVHPGPLTVGDMLAINLYLDFFKQSTCKP
ncbi:hypothetical protein ACFQ1L_17240 [Phytohabitans flavus]|uniref:hypothetical protein n=1 Tax=Phytohabitans flavus TaxID=1076124 RepID=UPI0036376A77